LRTFAPHISRNTDVRDTTWVDDATRGLDVVLAHYSHAFPQSGVDFSDQGFHALFTVIGHAETESNVRGNLTGWFSAPLSADGREMAVGQEGDPNALVVATDLPRGLEHGLRKYYSDESSVMRELDHLIARIGMEVKTQGGAVSPKLYWDLAKLAVENGIIPTPLLRAQYFGPLELFIAKFPKEGDDERERLNATIVRYAKQGLRAQGKSEDGVEQEVADLLRKAKSRRQVASTLRDKYGITEAENYVMFFNRSADNLFGLLDKHQFRNVEVIGHSGFFDIAAAYQRFKRTPGELHITRSPTPARRGQALVMKLDRDYRWLNDHGLLDGIKEKAAEAVRHYRGLSLDTALGVGGEGIVETPLLGFRRASGDRFESYSESLEDGLASPDPLILFGHGGQGKTILSTVIISKYLESGEYVPFTINCEEVNIRAERPIKHDGKSMYDYLLETSGVAALPEVLRDEIKFCFLIDDYQKLNTDYTERMSDAVHQLKAEGHQVVMLSRLERTDAQPPHTPGYKIMQIDTEQVAQDTDAFIQGRVTAERAEAFKEYVGQYDSSVLGYYLTKSFLTMIFPGNNGNTDSVLRYVVNPTVQQAITEGKPLTRTQLYDAHTDYRTGCDIHRMDGSLGDEQIRELIPQWKAQLAEKAFRDVFGKDVR